MQSAVEQYADQVHQTHGALVQIRVGLNSGEVVVRSIGSDLRMDYTAVGQTTHLAARMEQLARPGSILLAPETLALAEDSIIVQSLGPRPVKGLAHHCGGSYGAAVENFRDVGALLATRRDERFGEPGPPALFAMTFMCWSLAELGRFDEAIAIGGEALRTAEAVDQPFTLMHGYFLGIAHLERADLERAIPLLERGLALCRAADLHLWTAEIAADLGYAYALGAASTTQSRFWRRCSRRRPRRICDSPTPDSTRWSARPTGWRAAPQRPGGWPPGRSKSPARTSSAGTRCWPSTSAGWSATRRTRRRASARR